MNLRFPFLALATFCSLNCPASPLTVEEKIGQILMVHFHGNISNNEAKTLIQELFIGNFIYYEWANELSSPNQIRQLSTSLQELARQNPNPTPLLIAVDQEGGRVTRLKNGFTPLPSNEDLAGSDSPSAAFDLATTVGKELLDVGININLAPVVDIDSNPMNPVIGNRAYANTPATVIAYATQALLGYKQAGIATVLKHFPGHGDVDTDSHFALPIIRKTLIELEETELQPFRALAQKADAIMTAHLLVPALDPDHCTTLSRRSLEFLREQIGFKGIIITDSLAMKGVLGENNSISETAIKAFQAGCDIVLLGGRQLNASAGNLETSIETIREIHQNLVKAVNDNQISLDKLNSSVDKVMLLKSKL